ncbi:MAG TPA: cytochrome P450 [Terriglobales bacterium]|nr:cytochrome P450 [Terriglobales bacterium]
MATATASPLGSPLSNLLRFRRDPLTFFTAVATLGDAVPYQMGPRRVVFINDPEYIKDLLITSNRKFIKSLVLQRAKRVLGEGLLTSEGEFHLRQRRLAQPAFHRDRIAGYAVMMEGAAAELARKWQPGTIVDIHQEMMRLTLVIAGETLFGADVQRDAQEVSEALSDFMEMFGFIFLPFSKYLERLPIPPMSKVYKARHRLDRIIYRMIHERRAAGGDKGDLLSMLIAATDVEGDKTGMTDEQLRDECVTIFLAGHETTANALTYAWILLSQNPEIEQRLGEELLAVPNRELTIDDIPRLNYTRAVFAEAMRLYPPAWGLGRQALEEHSFDDVKVETGNMVICSQWVMQRDRRYWESPEEFRPERWLTEDKSRPRFTYFPFGAGPRQCIGESFAWTEGVLLLATLARRFQLRLRPGYQLRLRPAITLRPRDPVPMQLVRR